jgi:gamma-glutamylcyclotransferase (GGCT)/AIG2-like uncharacterized protein YtfP
MSNRILFVFNNLKVTFYPGDAPYDGFEILAGEAQCSTTGSLYDVGGDAAFESKGNSVIRGQIWTTYSYQLIDELRDFAFPKGNVRLQTVSVTITEDDQKIVIPATIFALEKIPLGAKKIDAGFWVVRSERR